MRTTLIKAQDVYCSEEEINKENTSEDSECEGSEDAYAHVGELLMIRETLNNQPSPQPDS